MGPLAPATQAPTGGTHAALAGAGHTALAGAAHAASAGAGHTIVPAVTNLAAAVGDFGTGVAHAIQSTTLPATIAPPGQSIFTKIQNFAYNWQSVFVIFFFAALLYVMWRTLKVMPRTKPQQIKPASSSSSGWEDIAGAEEAKAELQEIVEFLRDPREFRKLGAKVPRGILLHGPPGTGKTLLAKAVAHESGAVFYAQSAAAFVEMFAGLGAARIRRLFRIARQHEPAIIFIDELDAVGGRRGMDVSGERDQTLNQLLVEMDGFTTSGRLVVIAASNLLDKLDPALLRPGRFDRQIFVSPPDVKGREGILRVHTRDKPLDADVDLGAVAAQTSGLTGADLANICNEAAIFAARRKARRLSGVDFDSALERVIAGVQSQRVLNEHEKLVVAYHEAGHALCGELLPSVDRVHKISIVPRGRALGYTLNLPEEDRYLKTREELIDYMTMLLGGRAAEQIVFGAITTGASDDVKRVSEIAYAMVDDYAMGTQRASRTARDIQLSETTLRIRDEECHELIEEGRRAAVRIVAGHRPQLDALAKQLLTEEVLDREAIDRIMHGVPRQDHRRGLGLRVAAAEAAGPAVGPRPHVAPELSGEAVTES